MTTTIETGAVVLVTADGEAREARTYPDGSYACPFCSAAVISEASWDDNEANNARVYAASGDEYAVRSYPAYMGAAYTARTCANPGCMVNMIADQCAKVRAERDARQAETDRRARQNQAAMERIAETKAAQSAACEAAWAKCTAEGYCFKCWRHSTSSGLSDYRVTWTRHRDPSNCPRLRTRYGI